MAVGFVALPTDQSCHVASEQPLGANVCGITVTIKNRGVTNDCWIWPCLKMVHIQEWQDR